MQVLGLLLLPLLEWALAPFKADGGYEIAFSDHFSLIVSDLPDC